MTRKDSLLPARQRCITPVRMRTTLTIRTEPELRRALERRARAKGRTVPEVAREILRDALQDPPLGSRTGHLRGVLRLRRATTEAWRQALRGRNWRL